jgi:hypothetical protein
MPRKYSFPLRLRPQARTASLMLATVQAEGTNATRDLRSWLPEMIDVTVCQSFHETFGVTIGEFFKRGRRLSDAELKMHARDLADKQFAALGSSEGAGRDGGIPQFRRRGRIPRKKGTL